MKKICVLGSNSGRNAGDAAILSSIITNISRLCPGALFEVPAPRKRDIYSRFSPEQVRAVPIMPWNLSVRFIGLTTLLSIIRSDVVLITDGIIFDTSLFNPLFNFLIQLVFVVPFAKLFRKKVVCLLVGVGPLNSRCSKIFARYVCEACDDVFVRETQSAELLKSIGVSPDRISIYADAAMVDQPATEQRAKQILEENGLGEEDFLIGFNINAYADRWIAGEGGSIDAGRFGEELARALDGAIERFGCRAVLVLTQVMDVEYARGVVAKAKNSKDIVVMGNDRYSAEELMSVLGFMRLFVGMRLHSLILATAMDTPCIGLAYAPKVRHFMALLGRPDQTMELGDLTAELLLERIEKALGEREEALPALKARVAELKTLAGEGFRRFVDTYMK